jgi:hypothetical protein
MEIQISVNFVAFTDSLLVTCFNCDIMESSARSGGGISVGSGGLAALLPQEAKDILRMLSSFPNPNMKASGDRWGFIEGSPDGATAMDATPASADDDEGSDLFEMEADLDDESSYALSVEFQDDARGGAHSNSNVPSSTLRGASQSNVNDISVAGLTSSLGAELSVYYYCCCLHFTAHCCFCHLDASLDFADTVAARALLNRIRGAASSDRLGSGRGGANASGAPPGSLQANLVDQAVGTVAPGTNQLPVMTIQPDYRVEIVRLRSELIAQKDAFKDLVSLLA